MKTRSSQKTKHPHLLPKQPSHPLQHTILVWIIWMVFTRNLKHGGEWVGERVDTCPDSFRNLHIKNHQYAAIQDMDRAERTCWLIRTMAMSFLSFVKSWNAFSIVEVSVLESTTRKFRWASGPSVTCYCSRENMLVYDARI